MKRLCTVLARAGSVGVPGKNVRPLGGIPLVAHSIRLAREVDLFDMLVVSSDDHRVLEIAESEGVDATIVRPPELATAESSKIPALIHCVEASERLSGARFDVVVDLQPTSPLRVHADVSAVVEHLESRPELDNVVSVGPARHSPASTLVDVDVEQRLASLVRPDARTPVRRQDDPPCFALNGSIYAWWRRSLVPGARVISARTAVSVMPPERSFDIDSPLDWEIVEHLYGRRDLWVQAR